MKNLIRSKPYLIPVFVILGIGAVALFGWLFGTVVMLLWNATLVPATGAAVITFWQALGLLVLSRILVGGFGGGGKGRGQHMRNKWAQMTPQEKEQFKAYCRKRWGNYNADEAQVEEVQ
jgi:Ca2+/H+ antiporter, TMEM165/GDT1 family